jgi:predicted nucleic acid-binding protein
LSIYADTTLFVSFYLTDQHSHEANRLLAKRPALWLTPLHRAEWTSAIAQHVFRGSISDSEALQFYTNFSRDRGIGLWLEVDLPGNVFDVCIELTRIFTPRLGVRALDTLHIAAALELKAERFWTFDDRQKKLAKAVGLKTT